MLMVPGRARVDVRRRVPRRDDNQPGGGCGVARRGSNLAAPNPGDSDFTALRPLGRVSERECPSRLIVLGAIPVACSVRRSAQQRGRKSPQTLRPFGGLDHTRDPSTGFDLDLAVSDRARDVTTRADQQPLADDEITVEPARYLDIVDRGVAAEYAGLGDSHVLAVLQIRFDTPLDDEPVAGCDLARQ